MGLTFYPIEDITELEKFRRGLSSFMKAVQKTTRSEDIPLDEVISTCDKVITAAGSYNDQDELSRDWYHYIRDTSNQTIGEEHDKLIAASLE